MILQINHMCIVLSGSIGFEMGHDDKNETKFCKSRSKYAVSNDLHFTLYSEKLTLDVDGTRISLKIWLQGACNTFLLQST